MISPRCRSEYTSRETEKSLAFFPERMLNVRCEIWNFIIQIGPAHRTTTHGDQSVRSSHCSRTRSKKQRCAFWGVTFHEEFRTTLLKRRSLNFVSRRERSKNFGYGERDTHSYGA